MQMKLDVLKNTPVECLEMIVRPTFDREINPQQTPDQTQEEPLVVAQTAEAQAASWANAFLQYLGQPSASQL